MSKRGRLVELALGAVGLTGYTTFIYPMIRDAPLTQQLGINFIYLSSVMIVAWYVIRGAKDRPKQPVG